jgi:hypothetical protein
MKLSKLEKKVLAELKDKITYFCKREMLTDFDTFNEEDVDYRLNNIDLTIKLLKEEKAAIQMLNLD